MSARAASKTSKSAVRGSVSDASSRASFDALGSVPARGKIAVAIFPTQQGATTKVAFFSTQRASAASDAPPHACSATPTSKSSRKSSMRPCTTRTFASPARWTRRSATSSERRFRSTSANVASGNARARMSVWCPPPAPKSTTRARGLRRSAGATKSATFRSCWRFLAPRSAGTAPPSGCATSSAGGMASQSHSARASAAHLAPTDAENSAPSHGAQSGLREY